MPDKSKRFTDLRDEAKAAAASAHSRMLHELAVFNNRRGAYRENELVGGVAPITESSLNPEIQKGILRLVPAFVEQASRIEMLPDRSKFTVEEAESIEDLQNWTQMMQEVDNEGQRLQTAVYHNLVYGHAVAKAYYDPDFQVVRCMSVDPLSFAVDPACTETNLHNADFVVHSNRHTARHIRRHYPEFQIGEKREGKKGAVQSSMTYRVDEIWMRRYLAKFYGIDVEHSNKEIFKVTLIDDEVVRVRSSPFWYPDFPFTTWRNFPYMLGNGQAQSFWGHGYASLAWSQQKFLDEVYSNFILILRRLSVGRVISKKGALDLQNAFTGYGVNIEIDFDEAGISQLAEAVQPFPQDAVPPVLYQILQHSIEGIADMMPSLNPVFTGEAPFSGASGRAVNTLQWASFNQISANIRAMNEFRLARMRMLVSLTQQFARRPLRPHLWRRGIDFPEVFPDEARHIGYHLKMPDATSMPNTPTGKLQVAQVMAALGAQMSVDELIKFVGFDRGYGWDAETFSRARRYPWCTSPDQRRMLPPVLRPDPV